MELKQKLQAIWDPFWKSRTTWWPTLLSLFMDLKKKLQPSWERLWKFLVTWWPTSLNLWADLRGKSRLYRAWFYKPRFTWQLLMGLLLIGAMVFVLWKVPKWQLEGEKLQAERRIQLENDLRKTLAQIMGGAFVLLGGYLAWRRVTALERTVAVTQEGQITERFTRAIQLLGDRANLEVRLGGIYALERIAKDSPNDHWTIMEVLTAYVREKSPWKGNPSSGQDGPPYKPAPDIQSILTVIGRRTLEYEKDEDRTMNLMETDLRGVGLIGAHLEGVGFFGTHLEGAGLYRTHLERAVLVETHFEGARMCETHFEGAFLLASHLEGADLRGSHFERARLDRSNLDGANLDGANFDGANLEGVNLQGVKGLTKEQIKAAIIDDKTLLPHYLRNS